MATPPTRDALLRLYASTLRTARTFSSYNFRNYFLRRTKDEFRDIQNENDPAKLTAFFNKHVEELTAIKRAAIVNQLYGGWRLVVEKKDQPEAVLERSDN